MSRMNALLKRAACTNLVSQLPRTSTLSMRTMHTSRAVAAGGSHHTSQSGFHGEHHDDHAHEPVCTQMVLLRYNHAECLY